MYREQTGADPSSISVLWAGSSSEGGVPESLESSVDTIERTADDAIDADTLDATDVDCAVVVHDPPGTDGIERLAEIRDVDTDVPVVLLDREGSPEVASRATERGVTEYVPRTDEYDPDLVERVTDAVEERRIHADRLAELERDSDVLETLFEDLPVLLYVKDDEARHVRVSDQQGDPAEFLGKTDLEVFGEDRGRQGYEDDLRVIEEGERIVNREEGNLDWNQYFLTTKVPWRDDEGEIRGLVGVTREITERKRQERQLERQNERLRTVASVISHDVRTPLNLALGKADLVAQECDSEHVTDLQHALDRTNELLEDLLSLVRHGRWIEETELLDVAAVANPAWSTVETEDATLAIDQHFSLYADPDRLRELFENLFRNAVEHAGTDVTVRIGNLPGWPGFYVEDDGPGIPESDRDQVFESGYTTAEEGTGFGLAIVQVVAEAHGWDASVTESEDGGARFEFRGVEFE